MTLKIYNALTCKKDRFVSLVDGVASIYVCGVTVYDSCHVGHARCYVVFDILRRYLIHKGYRVRFVQNFTDIDDKIILRASETDSGDIKASVKMLTDRFIDDYFDKMDRLGIMRADVYPRATDCVQSMVDMIKILMEKGHAYSVEGDVFFSVETFSGYGSLAQKKLDDLKAGQRVRVDKKKRNPLDFVLWKSVKPGEPSWKSPWGLGRPGWHIECSVMALENLGESFDIHCGGKDLIFPHHENEKAQSESVHGKPMASYWMHNGFVRVDEKKMSKSLGNFFRLEELYRDFHPEVLRFFLLSAHYRSPIDFSQEGLEQSREQCQRGYMMLKNVKLRFKTMEIDLNTLPSFDENGLSKHLLSIHRKFLLAMDDDLNTSLAIACLFEIVQWVNVFLKDHPSVVSQDGEKDLKNAILLFKEISSVLFLFQREYRLVSERSDPVDILEKKLQTLLLRRKKARLMKDWTQADVIRKEILSSCSDILLEDTADDSIVFFRED